MRRFTRRAALISVLVLAGSQSGGAASLEEWRRDLDAIVEDVLAIHPDPFTEIGELAWRRQAAELKEELSGLDEPQRTVGLMRLVAALGDGHTLIELEDRDDALWYPVRIHEFSDGYFVTSAHESVRDLAGAEILEIAGHPVAEVVDDARSLFGADNRFDAKERLYAVHNAYLMRGLGHARPDGSLEATFRLRDQAMARRRLIPRPGDPGRFPPGVPIFEWRFRSEVTGLPFGSDDDWIAAYRNLRSSAFRELDESRPPYLQHRTRYTRRALPGHDAYYVQMNQTDDSGMVDFMGEALEEVDRLRPRRLVIDMRYNFGGDGSTVTPMIHHFVRREADPPWEELYLITGRKSFSAAIAAIDAFIEHTDATLVGEPAGAALNSFGDAVSRPYPSLGLSLHVSSLRHQLSHSADLRTFIPVDVPAPMSFRDYAAGRDPAVDPILEGDEMRSIPVVALHEGGAAARRIHHARAERFAKLDWYRPPTEIALRVVVDELVEQGRFEEAVETARLTTEIHPFVWNSWYNLANAQKAAGPPHAADRFRSYRCVIELAPTNWNVPSIRKLFAREGIDPVPAPGCPVGSP